MEGEKFIFASLSQESVREMTEGMAIYGYEDGHKMIGVASSVDEVRQIFSKGIPTLALVDESTLGEELRRKMTILIRRLSPGTHIVSLSDTVEPWSDSTWPREPKVEIFRRITQFQHPQG